MNKYILTKEDIKIFTDIVVVIYIVTFTFDASVSYTVGFYLPEHFYKYEMNRDMAEFVVHHQFPIYTTLEFVIFLLAPYIAQMIMFKYGRKAKYIYYISIIITISEGAMHLLGGSLWLIRA